jgi:Kringle domain
MEYQYSPLWDTGTTSRRLQGKNQCDIFREACQRWDSLEPHDHVNLPARKPLSGLEDNYCRNTDGEPAAWCYTTDNNTSRWMLCNVPICEVVYYNGTDPLNGSDEADNEGGAIDHKNVWISCIE